MFDRNISIKIIFRRFNYHRQALSRGSKNSSLSGKKRVFTGSIKFLFRDCKYRLIICLNYNKYFYIYHDYIH